MKDVAALMELQSLNLFLTKITDVGLEDLGRPEAVSRCEPDGSDIRRSVVDS
jgi:hypothetical protein